MSVPDPSDQAVTDRAALHAALGDPLRLAVVDALADGDLTPGQISAALDVPGNALAHHLKVLAEVGLVHRVRSAGDARRRYLALDPSRLADLRVGAVGTRWVADHVLFVCTANAARSRLAAAVWARASDVPASSAGRSPAAAVADGARRVAAQYGLALDDARPRPYAAVADRPDLVVTVCDAAREEGLPFAAPVLHWSLPDPVADGRPEAFDTVLRAIRDRVDRLAPRVVRSAAP